MIELLITAALLGIPATYVLRALLLEEKISHEGPFRSKTRWVIFEQPSPYSDGRRLPWEASFHQRVALFDWIRRLFGVYSVEGDHWFIRQHWLAELWTCPFCLSFWTSFLFSVPYALHTLDARSGAIFLFQFVVVHLMISIVSQVLYKILFE